MSARDGAVSVCDKYGRPIPPIWPIPPAPSAPAPERELAFIHEWHAVAIIFAIVGLVWLAVRA
jgi:hypothetical protein